MGYKAGVEQMGLGPPGRLRPRPAASSSRVADRLLCLQQAAGNRAVASAVASDGGVRVQRDPPTRAENIAALKRELAAAKGTAPSGDEWKYVAYRLNGSMRVTSRT